MKCYCADCSEKRAARAWKWARIALIIAAMAILAIAVNGCTVVPDPVKATAGSFDETGEQSSGFIAWADGGALIQPSSRNRYNALIKLYGKEFLPQLRRNEGIEPRGSHYFITNAALQKFLIMSDWRRMGRPPSK